MRGMGVFFMAHQGSIRRPVGLTESALGMSEPIVAIGGYNKYPDATCICGILADGTPVPIKVDEDGRLVIGAAFSGDFSIGDIEVSASVLPAGAATQDTLADAVSKLTELTESLGTIATKITACNTGSISGSIISSALPAGASTAAKQPALGTAGSPSSDVLSVQGVASGNPLIVTGQSVQRVSSTGMESFRILSATPCRLFELYGYNSGPAQFIQLHDISTLPAENSVPVWVFGISAQTSFSFTFGIHGIPFSAGCVVNNSSAIAIKTIGSANCFFTGLKG